MLVSHVRDKFTKMELIIIWGGESRQQQKVFGPEIQFLIS